MYAQNAVLSAIKDDRVHFIENEVFSEIYENTQATDESNKQKKPHQIIVKHNLINCYVGFLTLHVFGDHVLQKSKKGHLC